MPILAEDTSRYDLGHEATSEDIANIDIDVMPDGRGLPPGEGTVTNGEAVYQQQCAACHGVSGEGGPNDALVSTPANAGKKTIGSHWPYATTVFDYIRRSMPYDRPGSLSDNDVYALTSYLLYRNQLIARDVTLDADSLHRIEMPARALFVPDDRKGGMPIK
ncbi:MAG: cytochrome c [Gammaproteobacteria bacterium]|nr:cytochrome c [Gammaproteobacteria bacterium]MBT4492966.1 cytochrome c [Gammaproteobacteria bacterium]